MDRIAAGKRKLVGTKFYDKCWDESIECRKWCLYIFWPTVTNEHLRSKQDQLSYLVGALARISLEFQMHDNRDNNLQWLNLCIYHGSRIHGYIRCYTRVIWIKGVLGELGFAYVDPIILYIIDSTRAIKIKDLWLLAQRTLWNRSNKFLQTCCRKH